MHIFKDSQLLYHFTKLYEQDKQNSSFILVISFAVVSQTCNNTARYVHFLKHNATSLYQHRYSEPILPETPLPLHRPQSNPFNHQNNTNLLTACNLNWFPCAIHGAQQNVVRYEAKKNITIIIVVWKQSKKMFTPSISGNAKVAPLHNVIEVFISSIQMRHIWVYRSVQHTPTATRFPLTNTIKEEWKSKQTGRCRRKSIQTKNVATLRKRILTLKIYSLLTAKLRDKSATNLQKGNIREVQHFIPQFILLSVCSQKICQYMRRRLHDECIQAIVRD